jgi:putative ABC transport system permease protein
MTQQSSVEQSGAISKPMSMVTLLAYRNLFHDRLSLFVTLIGIIFSVVLVAVEAGIYLGTENRITAVLDHSDADLWLVPVGTKNFDDPSFLDGREKYAALSTSGIASMDELVVGFGRWRRLVTGSTTVLIVGSNTATNRLLPWDIVEGTLADLSAPFAVAVDKTYFGELGIKAPGDTGELNFRTVTAPVVTTGIRSFTTLPYIFTTVETARTLLGAAPEQTSYRMIKVAPGSNVEQVSDALKIELNAKQIDVEVVAHEVFRKRSLNHWLFETGAGLALIAGVLLAIVVGIVVVAQTLYASTKDHLNEFATLRALGGSAGFINKIIIMQAVLSAVMGYVFGVIMSLILIYLSRYTTLLIVMTPTLAVQLFVLTVGMCMIAAVAAVYKVVRIDPATVFSR